MDVPEILPFKVGQFAESRSFKTGFRGAWFRCQIKTMKKVMYALDFYDFSEEKVRWTRLYQKPQKGMIEEKLMLRPQYPPVYKESETPDANTDSEVIVIRNDVWKVGDEVDWFADGCYWSASVTEILTKETVQIVLLPPPAGEGLTYDVNCKDLRPSLDWSSKHGWSVPISKEAEDLRPCARLIKPAAKGPRTSETDPVFKRATKFPFLAGSSFDSSFSSDTSSSLPLANVGPVINGIERASCSDSSSTLQFRDASIRGNDDDVANSSEPTKRMRTGDDVPLNSTRSDTLEGTVLELEELVNKVKWLKGILQSGNLSKARRPSWKFLSHGASYSPK